jgi:Protein of unknown function (DUF3306)
MADRGRPTRTQREADEGFLRRWSRRKVQARSPAPAPAEAASDAADPALASPEQTPEPAPRTPAPIDPKDLPDIESLDASSDFTVFMRPGVPAHLRTLALRKLWRSDPIFSKLDGMVEYGEDYTIQSWPKGVIKTAYRIGRGFVDELEKLGAADAQSATPEGPVTGPEPEPGPARIAAAPAEPAPPEPASPREAGSSQQGPAQPAKRRRRLPARS